MPTKSLLSMFEKLSKKEEIKPKQKVTGRKHTQSEIWNGHRLIYRLNGLSSFFITLFIVTLLCSLGFIKHFGSCFTLAVITAFVVSLYLYIHFGIPRKVTQVWEPCESNDAINIGCADTAPFLPNIPLKDIVNEPLIAQCTEQKNIKRENVGEKTVETLTSQVERNGYNGHGFDPQFNQNKYFVLSNDKKTATFAKIGLPGAHDYQYYPACRVSHPIDTSDIRSQSITFKLFQYGWFGVGSDTVTPHGFPGYTDSGWMIRINNGGSWHGDVGNSFGSHITGDLTNHMVTMKYIPDIKQLTVVTQNGQQFIYTHKSMPQSGKAYFVFTMASGKVQIFDTATDNKTNELVK